MHQLDLLIRRFVSNEVEVRRDQGRPSTELRQLAAGYNAAKTRFFNLLKEQPPPDLEWLTVDQQPHFLFEVFQQQMINDANSSSAQN